MKPKGLVLAASITSQTSMPIRSSIIFISLTSAMLTARKMFSSSLAASATSGEETGTTLSIAARVERRPPPRATAASMPPTTLGMVWVLKSAVARVLALGREGEEEVLPALRARSPRGRGSSSSRVVPG